MKNIPNSKVLGNSRINLEKEAAIAKVVITNITTNSFNFPVIKEKFLLLQPKIKEK